METQDCYLRLPQVLKIYPYGRSTFLRKVKDGEIPPGVLLSKRIRAWKASELQKFFDNLQAQEV